MPKKSKPSASNSQKNTKRKRGAPKGNKNNLQHGFYSKLFSADENTRLDTVDTKELESEISLLKVMIDRLTKQLDTESDYWLTDNLGNKRRDDHYIAQLNTLSHMTTSLATLKRTQYLIQGRAGKITDAIEEAMEELRLEMGI